MPPTPQPRPSDQKSSRVVLDGHPLEYVPGTYEVKEAERFGEKISSGSLRYADFQPFESAHTIANFSGGYGLRRYSDSIPFVNFGQVSQTDDPALLSMYHASNFVDTRNGRPRLARKLNTETLPGATADAVWIGEFTPSAGAGPIAGVTRLVAVAGRKVFYRDRTRLVGTWTDSGIALGADPVKNAIGVFNGNLIIGFGSAAVAVYTNDLATTANVVNSTPANIYVGAITQDRAACYVAGGPTSTDAYTKVTSSANGITAYSTSPTLVGSDTNRIVAMAPGGGLNIVYVLRQYELGAINTSAVYITLLPFDSQPAVQAANPGLHWWLGTPGDRGEKGPMVLLFQRDGAPWIYEPSSQTAGSASNIAVWADPSFNPETARGAPISFAGTANWLFMWINNTGSATTYLLARNPQDGSMHTMYTHGDLSGNVMCFTSSVNVGNLPHLFFSGGTGVIYMAAEPLEGDTSLTPTIDDDGYNQFATAGTLTATDIDLGFPDEPKVFYSLNIVWEGTGTIQVTAYIDNNASFDLGTVTTTPSQILYFPSQTSGKRIRLVFALATANQDLTPELLGFSLRCSVNALLYRIISFDVKFPTAINEGQGQQMVNPETEMDAMWTIRRAGYPVQLRDRRDNLWQVRLVKLQEKEISRDPGASPEVIMSFGLLEITAGPGNIAYGSSFAIYGAMTSRYA